MFDTTNHIVQLCAQGMELEGAGKPAEAMATFMAAWHAACTDIEKMTAAHYLARHQSDAAAKLQWDETALVHAMQIPGDDIKQVYPSLYLNIARCYEDLNNHAAALEHYEMAASFAGYLPDDGYGNMIRNGITTALKRLKQG